MHYHIKLFLIVIAGSIALWFTVQTFVSSTDELAETFTVESFNPADHAGKSNVATHAELVALQQELNRDSKLDVELERKKVGDQDEPAQESNQVNAAGSANVLQPDPNSEKLNLPEESEQVTEDSTGIIIVNKALEIGENQEKVVERYDESEQSESVRADSDADMQAESENAEQSSNNRINNNQIKALELDKNLLEPVNIDEITKKTIKTEEKTVRAIDLAYALPKDSNCALPTEDHPRVGVHYRPTSYAIKGQSLTNIDKLIELYKKCGGKLLIVDNKAETDESDQHLIQLRQDEVKYYLLQRRIPKDDMIFSDN